MLSLVEHYTLGKDEFERREIYFTYKPTFTQSQLVKLILSPH